MIKQSIWKPDWEVIPEADKNLFRSMSTVLSFPMECVTQDKISGVSRLKQKSTYYVKTYSGKNERLKQLMGVSRFERELRNLNYFSRLGLGTPIVAAYGRESAMGFLRKGLLVTVGVEDAQSFEQLIEGGSLYARGVDHVRGLLEELAIAVKRLHEDGFFHRDLKTRNILVQQNAGSSRLFFFDCPSGYHPPAFLRRRCVIRDLAYLERGFRGHVRGSDMMYFYKIYRGVDKLSGADKALAREVVDYYDGRRMTQKRKVRAQRRILRKGY